MFALWLVSLPLKVFTSSCNTDLYTCLFFFPVFHNYPRFATRFILFLNVHTFIVATLSFHQQANQLIIHLLIHQSAIILNNSVVISGFLTAHKCQGWFPVFLEFSAMNSISALCYRKCYVCLFVVVLVICKC